MTLIPRLAQYSPRSRPLEPRSTGKEEKLKERKILKRKIREAYREWEKQRYNAIGPNDMAEIDAIFAREIGAMEASND